MALHALGPRYDPFSQRTVRRKDSVVTRQVGSGLWHQGRKPGALRQCRSQRQPHPRESLTQRPTDRAKDRQRRKRQGRQRRSALDLHLPALWRADGRRRDPHPTTSAPCATTRASGMKTLDNNGKIDAAARRQQAACALRSETDRSTALLSFPDRKTQRRKDRKWHGNTVRRRDRHTQTGQQPHARRSNLHRPRVHRAGSHRLRGFLPWGSSVACR
jgi:hypothetical protein